MALSWIQWLAFSRSATPWARSRTLNRKWDMKGVAEALKGCQTARFEEFRLNRWLKGPSVHWNLVRQYPFKDDWLCSCTKLASITHTWPSSTCSTHPVPCLSPSVLQDISIAIPTYEAMLTRVLDIKQAHLLTSSNDLIHGFDSIISPTELVKVTIG